MNPRLRQGGLLMCRGSPGGTLAQKEMMIMRHSRKDIPAEVAVLLAGVTLLVSGAVYAVGSGVYSLGIDAFRR
jgi:hypothetical protein